ncbi:nucleotide kinase domain-containing protein [Candidatus Poriferisodalis sp.]|uniref:nucleotide kinase domain-containing protein n=1 Tax=Candidatus Poriferisodalis sp. TaxID=3101277 RepID=UPI003B51D7AC
MPLATRDPDQGQLPFEENRVFRLAGRRVQVTEVFWSYWRLAAERQAIFYRRAAGELGPWTSDPILARHRFTNAYRASDRVSQYLLHHVIYDEERDALDTILRVLLFKIFNRIDTWEHLVDRVGQPAAAGFGTDGYAKALDELLDRGRRVYSAAYIMPSPRRGADRKHRDHLSLVEMLLRTGVLAHLERASSLRSLYERLCEVPSFGPFLAFQYAIDLNYSPHFDFDEMDFVVAGPGAVRGIRKCFADTGGLDAAEVIAAMADTATEFFEMTPTPTPFRDLWGRPLQLIDCQNLFCEVDKYARVAHPEHSLGGPGRIKQVYRVDQRPLTLGYPPKWGLPLSAQAPSCLGAAV